MKVPFLDLKAQYKQIEHEVVPIVTEAMENGMFIGGPNVEGFEKEFADFCSTSHLIGVFNWSLKLPVNIGKFIVGCFKTPFGFITVLVVTNN